jgi:hypothetical protein
MTASLACVNQSMPFNLTQSERIDPEITTTCAPKKFRTLIGSKGYSKISSLISIPHCSCFSVSYAHRLKWHLLKLDIFSPQDCHHISSPLRTTPLFLSVSSDVHRRLTARNQNDFLVFSPSRTQRTEEAEAVGGCLRTSKVSPFAPPLALLPSPLNHQINQA